jgi:predicted dehydrogenase
MVQPSSRIRVTRPVVAVAVAALALALGGCGSSDTSTVEAPTATSLPERTEAGEQQHPDVIDVVAEEESTGVFAFTVTISSPYDTPDRYADGWRVVGPDGTVYGEHTLTHDHANEQPFTRVQRGVAIPPDVDEVTVEGRDLEYGYGGSTVTVAIDS